MDVMGRFARQPRRSAAAKKRSDRLWCRSPKIRQIICLVAETMRFFCWQLLLVARSFCSQLLLLAACSFCWQLLLAARSFCWQLLLLAACSFCWQLLFAAPSFSL